MRRERKEGGGLQKRLGQHKKERGDDAGLDIALLAGGVISATALHGAGLLVKGVYKESSTLLKYFMLPNEVLHSVDIDYAILHKFKFPFITKDPDTENLILLTVKGILMIEFPTLNVYIYNRGNKLSKIQFKVTLPDNIFYLYRDAYSQYEQIVIKKPNEIEDNSSQSSLEYEQKNKDRVDALVYDFLLHMILNDFNVYLSTMNQYSNNNSEILKKIRTLIKYTQDISFKEKTGLFYGWNIFSIKKSDSGTDTGVTSSKTVLNRWIKENGDNLNSIFGEFSDKSYYYDANSGNANKISELGFFENIIENKFVLLYTTKENISKASENLFLKKYIGSLCYSLYQLST